MAIDFRCENCGKLLNVEAEPSSKIKCPYCKAKIVVPAGLASLPRPQVPGSADQAGIQSGTDAPGGEVQAQFEEDVPVEQDALMAVMAILMPWIISLFFHAGILVITAFITIVMFKSTGKADITVPDVPTPERLTEVMKRGQMRPDLRSKSLTPADDQWARRDSVVPMADLGKTENKIPLYGATGGAPGGGVKAPTGLITGGKKGPGTRFFGRESTAYHVVYVVDRSGSMLDTFDEVRMEIMQSLCQLNSQQTFHVIFFAAGKPKENPPHRLVFATEAKKAEAVKFLDKITPEGQTNPILALEQAFNVLGRTPGNKKGKLINLLTDGEFPDNEKVLKAIRARNSKGDVHINTFLHHHRCPDAIKVLKTIAQENKGVFKFIEPNE